jgi:glycosyltransferase involved in cell wall biosynthesis
MKILLVNTYHYLRGGDCTYTFALADLLKSHGHKVKFFGMKHPKNLPSTEEKYFLEYIDYVELNKNKSLANSLKVLTRSIYYKHARTKIGELIKNYKPDIVHLQNIHAHITPSILFEIKKNNIPIVWTLHDYKLVCPNSHYLIDKTGGICEACKSGSYYQPILKRCKKDSIMASLAISLEAYTHRLLGVRNIVDTFLTPSDFLRKKLTQYGFRSEKVMHLPLFLAESYFNKSSENSVYLLFLGRVDYIKGIIPLLIAMKKINNVKLKIVGGISERTNKEFYENISPSVEYLGAKYGEELHQLRKNALAFMVPSLCYENSPFSILEAFASGKPVIASDLGGMKDLVDDGVRGYLVHPGNVDELAQAMKKMVEKKAKTMEMGKNAYQYAKENHSAEKHYTKLIEIYERLIKK